MVRFMTKNGDSGFKATIFCGDVIPDHFPSSIGFFFPQAFGRKIRSLQPQVVDGNNGFDGAKVQLWKCAGDQYAKTWSPWTQEA